MKKIPVILFAAVALMGVPGSSFSVPNIWGVWSWEHTEPVQVMVSPGGSGTPLTSAALFGGAAADATIRVQLWYQDDSLEDPQPPAPVPDFPAEDIWVHAPGLVACLGAATADGPTDADGWFTFSQPLAMGGWTDPSAGSPVLYVLVAGNQIWTTQDELIAPSMMVNSPDINADLAVNLTDLGLFAADFYGDYSFRSDFFWDGVLNLADVGRFASGLGDECP